VYNSHCEKCTIHYYTYTTLFNGGADLANDGRAGADGVGHAAHGQGDNDDHGCARQGQWRLREGIQEADAQHRAGDDVGQHGERVHGAAGNTENLDRTGFKP